MNWFGISSFKLYSTFSTKQHATFRLHKDTGPWNAHPIFLFEQMGPLGISIVFLLTINKSWCCPRSILAFEKPASYTDTLFLGSDVSINRSASCFSRLYYKILIVYKNKNSCPLFTCVSSSLKTLELLDCQFVKLLVVAFLIDFWLD